MSLSKRDREFRLPKISYFDFKHLEMDRVLTGFFARLAHNGLPRSANPGIARPRRTARRCDLSRNRERAVWRSRSFRPRMEKP
jgi:hypothetical protein